MAISSARAAVRRNPPAEGPARGGARLGPAARSRVRRACRVRRQPERAPRLGRRSDHGDPKPADPRHTTLGGHSRCALRVGQIRHHPWICRSRPRRVDAANYAGPAGSRGRAIPPRPPPPPHESSAAFGVVGLLVRASATPNARQCDDAACVDSATASRFPRVPAPAPSRAPGRLVGTLRRVSAAVRDRPRAAFLATT